MESIRDYLCTWNPPADERLTSVIIEDETLRDGIQGPFIRRPSLDDKIELLRHSIAVGTGQAMLGFPASSEREYAECLALLRSIAQAKWSLAPHFLGRPVESDLVPITALQQTVAWPVWADFWINASPLRMKIEGWTLAELRKSTAQAARFLQREGLPFSVSLEDATRTPAASLEEFIKLSLDCGAGMIAICDTAGDATPQGAERITRFVVEIIASQTERVPVLWHGHNDRGLAFANALAAAEAGANIISGTFLGVGERAGNTPLEQVVSHLQQVGHALVRPECIPAYCQALAACLGLVIPDSQPLVGRQAFATAAGTHAAAITKALSLGEEFADFVFSGVPAASIRRRQEILIGPVMGSAGARYKLRQLGIEASGENIERLLVHARLRNACLDDAEILALFEPS